MEVNLFLCPLCKLSIRRESKFCPHCGKSIGSLRVNSGECCGTKYLISGITKAYCGKCGRPVLFTNLDDTNFSSARVGVEA